MPAPQLPAFDPRHVPESNATGHALARTFPRNFFLDIGRCRRSGRGQAHRHTGYFRRPGIDRSGVVTLCAAAAEAEVDGRILPGVKDCRIEGDKLPLVVISHGRGGSFFGHHDTAEALADAGFIVAAINHPGAADMSRSDDLAAFVERPTDIKRLINFVIQTSPVATKIDPQRIGFFGFSRGGYAGLVLFGANPDWAVVTEFCQQSSSHACEQIRRKEFPTEPLAHDVRIKAAVIADPLAIMFSHVSFAPIRVPVQLWQSQRGGDGVLPEHVAAVDKNLPAPHEYHVVPNSSHFAFLTPCPLIVAQARPELCTDAPGFDRVAFHKELGAEVLGFLRKHLARADRP